MNKLVGYTETDGGEAGTLPTSYCSSIADMEVYLAKSWVSEEQTDPKSSYIPRQVLMAALRGQFSVLEGLVHKSKAAAWIITVTSA